ncbi:phosphoacetylglucosamine mutase [Phlebopus sp. FC_14]|nr:phosphoacetylglucosamine mutase [Phlebopus sp. FC_14]
MSAPQFDQDSIIQLSQQKYPKRPHLTYQYGTAGFRTLGTDLGSVMFRVGVLAALRSRKKSGQTIGVMITASHNPAQDNGVKLVDPEGEMLETVWEPYATQLANAQSDDELRAALDRIINMESIDCTERARVIYARDTRPTGAELAKALKDGLDAAGAESTDFHETTTPILHYLVRATNTQGTKDVYGKATIDGYFDKLSKAFKKLLAGKHTPLLPLVIDCANGVGTYAAQQFKDKLSDILTLELRNTRTNEPEELNKSCGADYVKVNQKAPSSLALQRGQRSCSLDGDADRLIYYYVDQQHGFHMLDGDKISTLVASFIVEVVKTSGLDKDISVGVVQTAYANGSSTKYLAERLPVKCASTGVKHLHHEAQSFDVGVYFEANGHGTVLFSKSAQDKIASHKPASEAQSEAFVHLQNLIDVINQTVGDALSDMLLVEVILSHQSYGAEEWDALYSDLPNRLVKVVVKDRGAFKTADQERRLVSPPGLQPKIDELVREYEGGRSFVRPSGTEDVVRVYAEAKEQADELASRVARLVHDKAGRDL